MVEFEILDDKVENAWCFLIIGLYFIEDFFLENLCNDLGSDDMQTSLPGWKYNPFFLLSLYCLIDEVCNF